jgi:hypothetical protein
MGTWDNNDGLHIKYGNDEASVSKGGELMIPHAGELTWVFDFTSADLNGTSTVIFDEILLPNDLILESAILDVDTAFDSASETATLTIGLIDQDRSTVIDADGIDATIAETDLDSVGAQVVCDGALVGTQLSNSGYLTMAAGTEAFTAGAGRLTVVGRMKA